MKTVLVIEDNMFVRENIAEMLMLANYKVLKAENGKAGIEQALQQKPDIVVCDIMMPLMDGYAVLQEFKKAPELEDIPFVFLSAKSKSENIREGIEAGADDYITKPFQESELLNAVKGGLLNINEQHKQTRRPYRQG
ncbi:response regulator transcription factor [Pontibacter cellulosilyticus]|uniref:Response regulator n=1 Tax=Pontibacter cellulosilyticus TaxID=1720253 RepID=A0A923NBT6_9BACT|nr:response regulator [Pontibacter cellulosilyticus]MBC5994532.1 response regulator [Pontibacter cellulosilyticus]